mmetsp:Transcript_23753/g.50509  ORF Transcript_23753/g.50509 Transcript_23753/m.50509 type:complete len:399 (+) Transcript_23753:136-1332(+)
MHDGCFSQKENMVASSSMSIRNAKSLVSLRRLVENSFLFDLLEFRGKILDDLAALQLIGSGKASVFWSPRTVQQHNSLQFFDVTQVTVGVFLREARHDMIVEFLGALYLFPVTVLFLGSDQSGLLRPLHRGWLGNLEESDATIHVTVTIAANASSYSVHQVAVSVDHFHLFQSDVFTRLELDKILFAIHDANATVCQELSDVSGSEPAIIGVNFLGLLRHHIVSSRDVGTLEHDFSASPYVVTVHILSIGVQVRQASLVTDFGSRIQSHLHAGNEVSGNTGAQIIGFLDGQSGAGFGQTVALYQWESKGDTNKILDVSVEGTSSRNGVLDVATDELLELLEDQNVEEGSVQTDSHGKCAPLQGGVHEGLCNGRRQGNLGNNGLFDGVPNLGNGHHVCG